MTFINFYNSQTIPSVSIVHNIAQPFLSKGIFSVYSHIRKLVMEMSCISTNWLIKLASTVQPRLSELRLSEHFYYPNASSQYHA